MNLLTLVLQMLLTIPLTIILSFISKKENSLANRLIIPTIYIVIVAALLPIVKENIFLIVIFEIFIRNFYITNVTNSDKRTSSFLFIIECIVSIALSLFAYNYFISKVDSVIPSPETIKPFLWFIIILYLTHLYTVSTKEQKENNNKKIENIKKEQIIMQYAKFKNQYSSLVKSKTDTINNLTYAIMIYENHRNPKFNRRFNEYVGAVTKSERKQGIMQISSYDRITDEESIKIVINEMETINKKDKVKANSSLEKLLTRYNPEEQQEIINIYNEIVDFLKK